MDVLAGTAQPIPQPTASPTRRAVRLHAADPALTAWADWDLERAWRVLRGVGPLLGCPPPHWRDLGRLAYVTSKSAQPSWLPPGHIGRDTKGLFLPTRRAASICATAGCHVLGCWPSVSGAPRLMASPPPRSWPGPA